MGKKPEAQLVVDKNYAKGRVAIENLSETLGVSFECKTVDERIAILAAAAKETIKQGSFREMMSQGDEGATARLLSVVYGAASPALIARRAVAVMTGDTPSIRVPKGEPATAYLVGGKGGAPVSGEKYSYHPVVARLWECVPIVPRSLVEDATWDVIERQYAEGARAIAIAENDEVCTDMLADAPTINDLNTTGSSVLAWDDVASACAKVEAAHALLAGEYPADRGWQADTLIVNSAEYWQLMKDTNIIQLQTYGMSPPPIQTGKIPVLGGLQILKTNSLAAGSSLVLDSKNAGVLYVRRDITVENYADPINDLVGAVLTSRFRYETIRPTAISKITNTA